jgi:hypothetical protein
VISTGSGARVGEKSEQASAATCAFTSTHRKANIIKKLATFAQIGRELKVNVGGHSSVVARLSGRGVV